MRKFIKRPKALVIKHISYKKSSKNPKNIDSRYFPDQAMRAFIFDVSLLAKLLLLKKTGKKFLITIDDLVTIDNKSLPELREETFKVKSNNYDTEEEFKLYYRVKRAEDGKVSNYYVAHGRLVKPFTSEVKIDKLA